MEDVKILWQKFKVLYRDSARKSGIDLYGILVAFSPFSLPLGGDPGVRLAATGATGC